MDARCKKSTNLLAHDFRESVKFSGTLHDMPFNNLS